MRGLSVGLALEHHERSSELLDELQDVFGVDDVEVTIKNQVRLTNPDLPGVRYSYTRATDAEEAQAVAIMNRVLFGT